MNTNKPPVHTMFKLNNELYIKRETTPRWHAQITINGQLTDIHNIEWLDQTPNSDKSKKLIAKAAAFLNQEHKHGRI